MNYLPYVIGAYAVFALVLLWDGLSPRLRIRRVLREVACRQRQRTATPRPQRTELRR